MQRVFKKRNNENLGDYHDLYIQSDILLFANVFEKNIFELHPAHFLSALGLAWNHSLLNI